MYSYTRIMRPIVTVYLDSNDYSTLSDPKRLTVTLDKVRLELLRLAESGQVIFAFSGAHLSEMAPLNSQYTPAATARAELLVKLCGRNAFISYDRLIALEIARLANPELPPVQALSNDATWFPDLKDIISPVQLADLKQPIDKVIKEKGLNRHQRRTMKRKLFKANQPTAEMRELVNHIGSYANFNEILSIYPMRPQDAQVLGRYVIGKASVKAAEDAFLESLRDPSWMMRWFATHHDKLTHVTEWLRGPSRDMIARMREIAEAAKKLHEYEAALGPDFKADIFTQKGWQIEQNKLLVNVAVRLLQISHPGTSANINIEQVDKYCPGLSTTIRALHSSLWTSVGATPRTPQESDFVDAVHAMYAPYVKLFRADRYMAQHVNKQVKDLGVHVVSSLQDLPAQINGLIELSSEREG